MREIAPRARRLFRRLLPPLIGIVALAAVVWVVQPEDVVRAFEGFRAVVLVPVVVLLLLAHLAQGARRLPRTRGGHRGRRVVVRPGCSPRQRRRLPASRRACAECGDRSPRTGGRTQVRAASSAAGEKSGKGLTRANV
jgi:hypothetical protein